MRLRFAFTWKRHLARRGAPDDCSPFRRDSSSSAPPATWRITDLPGTSIHGRRGHLEVPETGGRRPAGLDRLKARAWTACHHGVLIRGVHEAHSLLGYIDGDYRDPATFARLRQVLGKREASSPRLAIRQHVRHRRGGTGKSGCAKVPVGSWRSLLPRPRLGRELNRTLHRFFPKSNLSMRPTKYLGRNGLNLIYFRFANRC